MDKAKRATSDFLGGVVTGALAAVASYQTVASVINGVQASIDRLDNISKVSQRVGIAAETLQELAYAGDLSDVSLESLATSAKKLSVFLAEVAGGGKEQTAIFKALGVEAKNTDGSIRNTSDVIGDLADKFAEMEDGPIKTALAIKVFGKAGADMIPLLNGGKKAFQEAREEAEKFGIKVSGDVAKQAEAFNDNLTRLGKITEGTYNQISSSVLPVLVAFSNAMVKAASDTQSVNAEAQRLAKDGSLFEWAKSAAIGLTYIIDAGEGAWRVIKGLGQAVGATFAYIDAARSTKLAIDDNVAKFNFSGAINAATAGAEQMKTILKGVGTDLEATFGGKLLGNKVRDSLEALQDPSKAQRENGWGARGGPGGGKKQPSAALIAALAGEKKAEREAVDEAAKAYQDYADALNAHDTELNAIILGTEKLTAAEKVLAEVTNLTSEKSRKLSDDGRAQIQEHLRNQIAKEKLAAAIDKERKATEEAAKARNSAFKDLEKQTDKLEDEARAEVDATAAIGLSKSELAERTAARYEDQAALADSLALSALEKQEDEASYELYKRQAKALRDRADAARAGADKQSGLDTLKKIDDFLDPSKAKSFGDALTDAFGSAGNALKGLGVALQDYTQKQSELNKLQKELADANGIKPEDRLKRELELTQKQGDLQISTYAAMAGAAKGFFAEGSKGYKTLQAAETAFQAYQLASDLVKGVSAAAVAVANQAQGDPYTAFARMAAMAAAMAALGFAISGGGGSGGGRSAADVQKAQGTGTVFGDSEAKSESISKSIKALEDTAKIELQTQSGMLAALKNIDASMAGLGNVLLRIPGLTSGKNLGIVEGQIGKNGADPLGIGRLGTKLPVIGNFINSLQGAIFGKTTQKIVDAGLSIKGSVGDLSAGQGVSQYASVDTTKSSLFGLSKKTSNSVQTAGVSDDVSRQFGLVFSNLGDVLVGAADALGQDTSLVGDAVSKFIVDIPTLSLKDLKGEELQAAIATAVSAQADVLGKAILPGLDEFQRVGEGYFETLVRVSGGIESANYELEKLGIAAIDYTDILYTQGDVAAEIVRQSISAAEGLTGVGNIIETFSGSAEDLAKLYGSLKDVQGSLRSVGESGDALSVSMIRGAGGLDALASSLDSYLSNFFTKEEQTSAGLARLGEDLAKLGINTVPATREAFRDLVESIDPTTASGGELYAQLIGLSAEFADLVPAAESAADATARLAKEQEDAAEAAAQLRNAVSSALDGVISDFIGGTDLASYRASRIAEQLQAAGIDASTEGVLGGTRQDIVDLWNSVGDEAKLVVADLYDDWVTLQTDLAQSGIDDFLSGLGVSADELMSAYEELNPAADNLVETWRKTKTEAQELADALAEIDGTQAVSALDTLRATIAKRDGLQGVVDSNAGKAFDLRVGQGGQQAVDLLRKREADLWRQFASTNSPEIAQAITDTTLQRIQLEGDLQADANKAQITALEEQIAAAEKLRDLAADMGDFILSLQAGSLSNLSYTGRLGAQKTLLDNAINTGGDVQGQAQAYLQQAQSAYGGSSAQYAAIFDQTVAQLKGVGLDLGAANAQISEAQQQLDALNALSDTSGQQITAIEELNVSFGGAIDGLNGSIDSQTQILRDQLTTMQTTIENQERQIEQAGLAFTLMTQQLAAISTSVASQSRADELAAV